MAERKENLKKSLDINEYPWSSDDDEPASNPPAPAEGTHPEPAAESTNTPRASGSSNQMALCPSPRSQARSDRNNYWNILNNPSLNPTMSQPVVTYSLGNSPRRRPMPHRSASSSDLQHFLSFRKFTDALSNVRRQNSEPMPAYLSPASGPGHSQSPSAQAAAAGTSGSGGANPPQSSSSIGWLNSRSGSMDGSILFKRHIRRMTPMSAVGHLRTIYRTMRRGPHNRRVCGHIDLSNASDFTQNNNALRDHPPADLFNSEDETDSPPVNLTRDANPAAEIDNIEAGDAYASGAMEEMVYEPPAAPDAADPDAAPAPVNPAADDPNEKPVTAGVEQQRQSPEPRSEREPQANRDDQGSVKEFNQRLLRLLECPVCLEWMEPPLSQCRRGHLVCGRCRARLATCPVCRTTFSSVRNRAMEAVAEMLRYPCRHGCGRETRLRLRTLHEASCSARRYRCPAPPCHARLPMPLHALLPHAQAKHETMLKIGSKHKFTVKVNSELHEHWLIVSDSDLFHLRVDVDIRTWGVTAYIAYIGPKCKASSFIYEISVVGQHNGRKIVYTRATHSDLENASLNVSRKDCFHLTLDQALNYLRFKNKHCEPDKFLDFDVEISKSENVVNDDCNDQNDMEMSW